MTTENVPPDDPMPASSPPDPLAHVVHGDPAVCLAEWHRQGHPDVGICWANDPMGLGLICCRMDGHPGQHIAEGERRHKVVATWPAAVAA